MFENAERLAENWVNGNRTDVARELSDGSYAGHQIARIALYLSTMLGEYDANRLAELISEVA